MSPMPPRSRDPLRWAPIVVLVVLLGGLATLQWRWSGELAEAETRRRQEASARLAERMVAGLDRELTRAMLSFHPGPDPAARLEAAASCWEEWEQHAPWPDLVVELWWVEPPSPGPGRPRALRSRRESPRFEVVDLPEDLTRLLAGQGREAGLRGLLGEGPAVLTLPLPGRLPDLESMADPADPGGGEPAGNLGAGPRRRADRGAGRGWRDRPLGSDARPSQLVLSLDPEVLVDLVLPDLLAAEAGLEPDLRIGIRDASGALRWAGEGSGPASGGPESVDVEIAVSGFGGGRQVAELLRQGWGPRDAWPRGGLPGLSVEGGGRGAGSSRPVGRPFLSRWRDLAGAEGSWALVVGHRTGSLEATVRRHRQRNLAVGLGILGLLTATVAMLLAGTRRAQDLARQRLDLVAGITHDLRSPVAAIASLADNLRDGVVAGEEDVSRYGETIGRESRRLRDLIEQGLALAGLEAVGGRETGVFDLRALVEEALVDEALVDEVVDEAVVQEAVVQEAVVEEALGAPPLVPLGRGGRKQGTEGKGGTQGSSRRAAIGP
jgi:hypothetical protein